MKISYDPEDPETNTSFCIDDAEEEKTLTDWLKSLEIGYIKTKIPIGGGKKITSIVLQTIETEEEVEE